MWPFRAIPIQLRHAEVHVHADRRLAFQVLTAWGGAGPDGKPTSRVIGEQDGRLLIEFRTPMSLFGRTKVFRTVEWVTLTPPERIDFEAAEGPLSILRDRFTLEDRGGCTRFRYESTIGVRGWLAGWLIGKLFVQAIMERFMRRHLAELKETIEARARRSKVYPQAPCREAMEGVDVPA